MVLTDRWWGLLIGNSRNHWTAWEGSQLLCLWHGEPGYPLAPPRPLVWATVVPARGEVWRSLGREITLGDLALPGMYSTLGIDRALALMGAGAIYGFPCLVIDGGTALTFTAADDQGRFFGGAILPGLALQKRSLAQGTAALPAIGENPLPDRWTHSTPEAIASGIGYGLRATVRDFVADWRSHFSQGAVVVTGGDGPWIAQQLEAVHHDPAIIFRGMAHWRSIVKTTQF